MEACFNATAEKQSDNDKQQRKGRCFLCGLQLDVITRTNEESVVTHLVYEWISRSAVAPAETRGQLGIPEEGERPPLEAVTRGMVRNQQGENTYVCGLVKCVD
jgi:hypothetical protein